MKIYKYQRKLFLLFGLFFLFNWLFVVNCFAQVTKADFHFTVSGNSVTFSNTSTSTSGFINKSKSYFLLDDNSGTKYLSTISNTFTHIYTKQQVYNVCITIQDSITNEMDSICHPINTSLLAPDTVSGIIYADTNKNGNFDLGEPPIQHEIVYLCGLTNCPYTYTDSNGYYYFLTSPQIVSYVYLSYNIMTTQPSGSQNYYTVLFASNGIYSAGYNFGMGLTRCDGSADFYYHTNCDSITYIGLKDYRGIKRKYYVDYGDGITDSIIQKHKYSMDGNYTVEIICYDSILQCYDTVVQTINISRTPPPKASFTYQISNDSVYIQNTSTGYFTGVYWLIYGANTSIFDTASQSLIFIPIQAGKYIISIDVHSALGCFDTTNQNLTINFINQDTLSGYVFYDLNKNGIKDTFENFAIGKSVSITDSITGTKIYTTTNNAGFYQFIVKSSVYFISIDTTSNLNIEISSPIKKFYGPTSNKLNKNLQGFDFGMYSKTCPKIDSVQVNPISNPGGVIFGASFSNWSYGIQLKWIFGDSTLSNWSTSSSINHIYLLNTTFNPFVLVTVDGCATDTFHIKPIHLVNCAYQSNYSFSSISCSPNLLFQPNAINASCTYLWNFGDSTSSTLNSPIHLFPHTGFFLVKLTTIDTINHCIDSTQQQVYITSVIKPLRASITYNLINDTTVWVSSFNSYGNFLNVYWYYDDGTIDSTYYAYHTFNDTGMHLIVLKLIDINNCVDFDSVYVQIKNHNSTSLKENLNFKKNAAVKIFPNPALQNETIKIIIESPKNDLELIITNVLGVEILNLTHQENLIELSRNLLATGVYFYTIKSKQLIIGRGKLIIE